VRGRGRGTLRTAADPGADQAQGAPGAPGTLGRVPGRFYVTTPIYYVNDAPHIGHAYTMVHADAQARWHRQLGDDVFFLTGTDEHGAKVAEAAAEHGVTPEAWTDQTVQRFLDAWRRLDIANDDFIRTTEPRHHRAVQAFLQRIYDNGYIELGTYQGLYCVACEDYYTEEQLEDGLCPIHHRPVVPYKEENYFFKLSAFEQRLLEWYDEHPGAVAPATRRNEALGFIRGGLRDISITRTSFSWGVEVPWDPAHVFYVWYDALINYCTAIGFGSDDDRFAAWWPAVHHLIGKDILKFHCVWWPAMCMAAGVDPPAHIFVHGWLLVGGKKLSKSQVADGTVSVTEIVPTELTDDFGVDPIRYHLLRDTPFGPDGEFTYQGITARYNADLANNLGNLMSRVATVVASKCEGIGPRPPADSPLSEVAASVVTAAVSSWERNAPNEALEATWRLIGAANAELEATEPWKSEPGPVVEAVLGSALEVLRIVALLVVAAMPATARELWRRLGLEGSPDQCRLPEDAGWGGYPGGRPVEKGPPLFPRRRD
jgi:methionyl-tRNA synthetase